MEKTLSKASMREKKVGRTLANKKAKGMAKMRLIIKETRTRHKETIRCMKRWTLDHIETMVSTVVERLGKKAWSTQLNTPDSSQRSKRNTSTEYLTKIVLASHMA
jgi:hypothetical protein